MSPAASHPQQPPTAPRPGSGGENQDAITPGALVGGVDVGASATKVVLLDHRGQWMGQAVQPSGVDYSATARQCLRLALQAAGAGEERLQQLVATGYGRHNVEGAHCTMTEIHCHGLGCYHLLRQAITIVDIGGQDNKVIRVDAAGQRQEFKMNRKCAAGTGAFVEEIGLRLAIDPGAMDALARQSTTPVRLNSFCTVFAKTEILSFLRKGARVEDIVRGAFVAVIQRVMEMDPLEGQVVLTGGVVAHNPTIAEILGEKLGRGVHVPPQPQFTGALGAALTALKNND